MKKLQGYQVLGLSLEVVFSVLILINFLSGIVGGLWLVFTGGLSLVVQGIILSIAMPFVYSILFLPGMGLAALMVKLIERGNTFITSIVGFISAIYQNSIIAIWALLVFNIFINSANQYSLFPLLLWGYSTVIAPLGYMAKGESPDSIGTFMGFLLAQLSFVSLAVLFLMNASSINYLVITGLVLLFSAVSSIILRKAMGSLNHNVKRILCVEDDTLLLKMYVKKLENSGYKVDTAINGELGLNKIKNNQYELILTGIMMPKLTGIDMLKKMRQENINNGVVIVLTNLADEKLKKEAISLGAKEYLLKQAFTTDQIVEVVNKYI